MPQTDNATPHSSQTYDVQVRRTIPYYDLFHTETINLIKAAQPNPHYWLDTGCGTGNLTQKAAPQFPQTKFVLCDPSIQMLQVAKQKLRNFSNVEFLEAAPTEKLRGELDGKFDVVTVIQSHHYLQPQLHQQATETCYRLLSPNGVFVTFENIRPSTVRGTEIGKEMWRQFEIQSGKTPSEAQTHLNRFGVEYHPLTVAEHVASMQKAGFSVVELLWQSVMQAGFYGVK